MNGKILEIFVLFIDDPTRYERFNVVFFLNNYELSIQVNNVNSSKKKKQFNLNILNQSKSIFCAP